MIIPISIAAYLTISALVAGFMAQKDGDIIFGDTPEYVLQGLFWPVFLLLGGPAHLGKLAYKKLEQRQKRLSLPRARLVEED